MKMVTCPYCAFHGSLVKFTIKRKDGSYSRRMFNCPDCDNTMYEQTLTARVGFEEWAVWLASNGVHYGSEFLSRVKWEKLLARIKCMGFSYDFWKLYRETKNAFPNLALPTQERLLNIMAINDKNVLTQTRLPV